MLVNSLQVLVFLPPVVIVTYATPQRARWLLLLVASYYDGTDLLAAPEGFEDPDHMSPDGAALLLERIAEDTGPRL